MAQKPRHDNPLETVVNDIEQAIIAVGNGMRKLNESRLTRKAIVHLLFMSMNKRVGIDTIETVLDNLDSLEDTYLKKEKVNDHR